MKIVRGVCPHDCPDSCGIVTEVVDNTAVSFYADQEHPITQGWLCAKVRPYLNHVYHPDRLKTPLRRAGAKGAGQWHPITWDEALAEIGERWRGIIADYGAEAILPHSYSGTLGMVQLGVANGRFWNRLGASQLQRSICGAAAETAVQFTLGKRWSPPYQHVSHSKLVLVWGHNPVSTAPHFMPFLNAARKNGTQLIVIDPIQTRTAKQADWHIAPIPGTDGALALTLANIIVSNNWHDDAWLHAHTVGWSAYKAHLTQYAPQRMAPIIDLPEKTLYELAQLYATTQPALIKFADGLQRNFNGGQTVRAICTLPALTGQYGKLGGGVMYSSSGYNGWDGEALNYWSQSPAPGRVVNMNRLGAALNGEVQEPPIQSLYVFASNPAAISPNAGLIVEGLKRDDLFTVVHELFMTDTAVYADIVLPATSQLEHVDLHKAYGHTILGYNAPAIPPLGESKSNWEVMTLLAETMGFDEPWLQQTADEIIEEVLQATAQHNAYVRGITLERLKKEIYVPLNLDEPVPFANGRFPTPSGKVELYSKSMADVGLNPLPQWQERLDDGEVALAENGRFPQDKGLFLISSAAHHFVSSTFANQDALVAREGAPFIQIHPQDAQIRGLTNGEWVIVENGRGWCELVAQVSDKVRMGTVFSPKGRWSKRGNGRNINWTTSDALGDLAGQSTFHSTRVWIRPKKTAS